MVKARKAALNDVPGLKHLYFDLMARFEKMDSFDRQDRNYWKAKANAVLRKMVKGKDGIIIVLEEKRNLIGFIELKILKREQIFKIKRDFHIEAMYISPSHRKKGYSRLLLDEAMKWFKKKGMKYLTVGTHAKDAGANSFWKKMGFKEYNVKYRK